MEKDRGKIILVADGNRKRLDYVQKVLTDAGYSVLTTHSAETAEALADTDAAFDLVTYAVVMDLGGKGGVHLAEHIEKSTRTNSTLLVSHFNRELLWRVQSEPGHEKNVGTRDTSEIPGQPERPTDLSSDAYSIPRWGSATAKSSINDSTSNVEGRRSAFSITPRLPQFRRYIFRNSFRLGLLARPEGFLLLGPRRRS